MYGDCVLSRERGAQRHLSFDDVAKANLLSQDPNSMVQLREKQNFSSFKPHAKVHSFRDHYRDIDMGSVGGHAVL